MATKACWGIDVGQTALKALKLRYSGGELEAVSFDVIEHAKILSQPDADEQQLIRNALDKFLSRNSVKGDIVVVGVPGQASFSRFIKLPPVELRKVPEIVKYEARQQIPFNLNEVIWDYQTMTMPAGGPVEVEVGIFAMKRDIVQDYVNDFTQVKIQPDLVQMAPVALYNYLRYDRHDGAGATLLLDVGAENTSLVIADGYRVWIRNFPLGGNNFTQALVKAFKLTFSKAENLKRHAAESKYAREVFQAMRPVFADLLTEIQRSIGFYTSLHRESRIERVLAMGSTFRLAGLQKFLSQSLGVDVVKVEQFNTLRGDQVVNAPVFKENLLSFGVSFGLALQGLGLGTITTSLLPPEILKEKELRRKRPFVIGAAAGIVVAFGLLAYGASQSLDTLKQPPGVDDLGSLDKPDGGVLKKVKELNSQNDAAKGKFDTNRTALLAKQADLNQYLDVNNYRDLWFRIVRDVWTALPTDPRLLEYKPGAEGPSAIAWESLNIVEVLSLWGEVREVTAKDGSKVPMLFVVMEATSPNEKTLLEGFVGSLRKVNYFQDFGLDYKTLFKNSPSFPAGYEKEKPKAPGETPGAGGGEPGARGGVITPGITEPGMITPPAPGTEEPIKVVKSLLPWRGNDTWCRIHWVVSLTARNVEVDTKALEEAGGAGGQGAGGLGTGGQEPITPTFEPGSGMEAP